ncbi:polysaccharide deacetylase family protein [Temperatibacter marinus]|uniref:Chitooligosaccharide deacetylase n=1 Tax=Temperatibacter marinus TaxID=1456591 RepID=A0AA52HAD7_9PROT|nr:polysaccharide deacetylase family protein [Temperatibacter marinus]WND03517.1 polysaccharide deacetylase family protein [Temperatibacter marinus]
MTLPKNYLTYENRRHGMDHDLYSFSPLFDRAPVTWPSSKKVALWITVALEYFPLVPNEGPFKAPGHMVTPYPDYRTYTTRDYGNRVGIFRILKVLETLGIKASIPMNAALAERYPSLLSEIVAGGHEIVAHSIDMNSLHYGGMDIDVERSQITQSLDTLRTLSGQSITGWVSPARSQSENTLALLAEAGLAYQADWVNDDMPYVMKTDKGKIVSMPHTMELEDRHLLVNLGQNEDVYQEQILEAFDCFQKESSSHGGRLLHLNLTPYVIGQPWRIQALKQVLKSLIDSNDIWTATGHEIMSCWKEQQ